MLFPKLFANLLMQTSEM